MGFFSSIGKSLLGKSKVDPETLDELEEILVRSDVGVKTTLAYIDRLEARVAKEKYKSEEQLQRMIREEAVSLLKMNDPVAQGWTESSIPSPYVVLIVGVNGVGKTTSIGKLAHRYKHLGKKVMLGAADTFRAAAVDQLNIWAERAGVPIVQQGQHADPAAVAFDTVESGIAKEMDVILVDTAGRLHNKGSLMEELAKIKRVMGKVSEEYPHDVWLVLDASTGQNAINQAKAFQEVVDVSGLILTKLDGTAKGGIVLGISHELQLPVRYIGTGEGLDDLAPFDAEAFISKMM
ncbi:MAG: signal recognition particle-docking protein FtsY [Rhodothermaeota bacterium MED-G64]|nr:MAG: signal recognition particle-docking protein FtsY [Rhodothermaeota bacterium MED-G64]RPF78953.1 MAG: signal recognition particle-docking protein FtsY [Rhodothermaceae bacterium TMED105]RPF79038.1 MAG: signal recognition particle-docking protein FtsY [Rhodothermaceae bacterium TMED105]RPF80740.1 MAG: signal recognition particle-docking protein FtsY [Rhodothermaceae bacterium TMED105]HBD42394.1 signal recognition particle-docking protein FtsY [Bacteroidota bacterium]|tara:strand:+ start:3132 stop:4007 length:876 start_codon:yes stop_codon:yes gene_type:complete